MPILNVYVDDATMVALQKISQEMGGNIEELVEAAVAEAAWGAARGQPPRRSRTAH
jgi:hypothetical protein